ncbi:MAG: ribonuclease P protein component [Bdellovibrionota bacterium]
MNKLCFKNRIKKRKVFLEIQETSEKLFTKHFLIFTRKSKDKHSKIGITVSKKVDKRAVYRNKLRRRIKEFFRLTKKRFNSPYEIVIIAKKNAINMSFHDIHKEAIRISFFITRLLLIMFSADNISTDNINVDNTSSNKKKTKD